MPPRVHPSSKGLQALVNEFIGDDPQRVEQFESRLADLNIGIEIKRLRTEAALTMRALADKIGTQPSVIARLERADYKGHSLSMLRRIAAALGRRLVMSFPPIEAAVLDRATPIGLDTPRNGANAARHRVPAKALTVPVQPVRKTTKARKAREN